MSFMNILLLMQLLPEPGRPERKAADTLSPCDRQALSCAARLKRQWPEARLAAAVITSADDVLLPEEEGSPSLRPSEAAASVIRNALALGADDAVQIPVPVRSGLKVPDGAGLIRMTESFFSVSFSLILTGFHMSPLLTGEAARRMGFSFCRNVTGLRRPEEAFSDSMTVQFKNGRDFFLCREQLPLLAEIVRSPLPPEQPSFTAVADSYRYSIPVLPYEEGEDTAAEGSAGPVLSETAPTYARPSSFPVFFDAEKTAPSQIAKELFSILAGLRLLPEASGSGYLRDNDPAASVPVSDPAADFCAPEAAGQAANPLTWADRIVSVGRGAIGPGETTQEVLSLAQRLAERLQAEPGSSKAAVDLGLFPASRQVGKTSSIAAPDLYIACGISGSIQHQDGMRRSRFIVAINNDPEAAIFRIADVCICGDILEILRALTD